MFPISPFAHIAMQFSRPSDHSSVHTRLKEKRCTFADRLCPCAYTWTPRHLRISALLHILWNLKNRSDMVLRLFTCCHYESTRAAQKPFSFFFISLRQSETSSPSLFG